MNNFKIAARNIVSGNGNQLGKIIFLGAGFAAGLMLLTKVWFEYSYEQFYPDTERIYAIEYNYVEDGEDETLTNVPGGIAPYLKERLPVIEAATRYTWLGPADGVFFTRKRQALSGRVIMADSCFFDILPRPMVVGNAKEILGRPMYAVVSRSLADKFDGDAVGQTIELNDYPGKTVTIGGVFEDVPENTLYKYDVIVSLSSIGNFMFDGSDRINGNERYKAFVKLYPATDPVRFNEDIMGVIEQTGIYKLLKEWGIQMQVYAKPLRDIYKTDPDVKKWPSSFRFSLFRSL